MGGAGVASWTRSGSSQRSRCGAPRSAIGADGIDGGGGGVHDDDYDDDGSGVVPLACAAGAGVWHGR